jgi:hypothetical protein
MQSKIIIMLTHNDKTVEDALSFFKTSSDLPVEFWGFKDVGLPKPKMQELVGAMKGAGKKTFLEVVTYSEDECMRGAKLAVELGFDYLMGTVYHKSVLAYLKTQAINYLPFCGKVYGSPSVLKGTIPEIIKDANWLLDQGVYGIDLLAFRHADGSGLARAYCGQIKKPVVIAGSINSNERIDFINEINPWAFTMGSALFTKNFVPAGDFRTNLQKVVEYMASIK